MNYSEQIQKLATIVMESPKTSVQGFHRLAASASETADNINLDMGTRRIYRLEEAKNLVQAVWTHDSSLFTHIVLQVAACIAERCNG